MSQQIIVYIIVFIAAVYLLYKWKIQKIISKKLNTNENKAPASSCGSGCGSCSVPSKPKKFS
ncbi:hypothetical protein [Silvanigrella sp.]|jgi:hypothetical protein|uniref:hypothetical protein n=1 Tax=Silvanigrella sp. TaxID=2024976 RepID=UPI0037CC5E92